MLKRLPLFLFFLCCAFSSTYAQGWERVFPSYEVNDLKDVCWWNGDTAFACGLDGTLLRSVNGGNDWEHIDHNQNSLDFIKIAAGESKVYIWAVRAWWEEIGVTDTLVRVFSYDPRSGIMEDLSFAGPMQVDYYRFSIKFEARDGYVFLHGFSYNGPVYRLNTATNEWEVISVDLITLGSVAMPDGGFLYIRRAWSDLDSVWVHYTSDGGNTWTEELSSGLPQLQMDCMTAMHKTATGTRIVLAHRYSLYYTDDMGKTWTRTSEIPWEAYLNLQVSYIAMASADRWFVMGPESDIYQTTDAGQTWIFMKEPDKKLTQWNAQARGIAWNGNEGLLAVCDGGYVYVSSSGGIAWDARMVPQISYVIKLHFFDKSHGIAVGYDIQNKSWIYSTSDGGESWTSTGQFEITTYSGLLFDEGPDRIYGYEIRVDTANGSEFVLSSSTDLGLTWTVEHTSMVGPYVNGLHIAGSKWVIPTMWGADPQGIFVSDDRGIAWTLYESAFTPADMQGGKRPDGTEVYYAFPRYPETAMLYRSTDECQTWQAFHSGSFVPGMMYNELDVLSADTLMARSGAALHITFNGGAKWEKVIPPAPPENFSPAYAFIPPVMYSVDGPLLVRRTDDLWKTQTIQVQKSRQIYLPTEFFFLDSENGWVACGPEIYRTSDGGSTWVHPTADAPDGFGISAVYPNPVTVGSGVNIQIATVGAQRTVPMIVSVYDLLGREVAVLYEGPMEGDSRILTWTPQGVPLGLYRIVLQSGTYREVKPVLVIG